MNLRNSGYGRFWALVVLVLLVTTPTAGAFYWLGMPASGVTAPPSIVPSVTPTTATTPTTPATPPGHVPEPATFAGAAGGFVALAIGKLIGLRRKRHNLTVGRSSRSS